MHLGIRALPVMALGLALSSAVAHAQLHLSGHTTGYFTDLSEANTTVVNGAGGTSASFATGIAASGSTQSKITFASSSFNNVGSGEAIQTGLFTITNGMTLIGSGANEAKFNLGLSLTSPESTSFAINTITFNIDHTPNGQSGIPDSFGVSFNQPAPVKIGDTLVKFHVDVKPLDFQVAENATVKKGDIVVSFTSDFTPVPEPTTYALWGAALLIGLVAYRRFRSRRELPGLSAIG